MAVIPPTQDRFHITFVGLVRLVSELNTKCYNAGYKNVSPTLVNIAVVALEAFDKEDLIKMFIEKTYQHWDKIRNKEEEYFYNKAGEIFAAVPRVDMPGVFRSLFKATDANGNKIVPEDDRAAIFNIFISCIKICIKHIHENRKPQPSQTYSRSYFDHIDVRTEAEKFKIVLTW